MAFVEDQVIQDFWLQREIAKRITPDKMQQRYQEKLKSMPAEEEVHARHILVATEAEAKDLLAELKKGTPIDKLAKEKSTDKASGAEGGDLGWFKRTDMVKEFSDAAFALKKGELSETPVKTQFGYHVIKVEDRRQAPPPASRRWPSRSARNSPRETVTAIHRPAARRRQDREIQHRRHQARPGGGQAGDAGRPRTARAPARLPSKTHVLRCFWCSLRLRPPAQRHGGPQGELDVHASLPYRRLRPRRRRRCRASPASSSPRRRRASATRTATTSCWRCCRPAPPSPAC